MLVGLLLCCLAVPRFWQSTGTQDHGLAATESRARAHEGSTNARVNQLAEEMLRMITGSTTSVTGSFGGTSLTAPIYDPASGNYISLCPPPTIEALIDTARWRGGNFGGSDGLLIPSRPEAFPSIETPLTPPDEQWPWADSQVTVVDGPNPHILAALSGIGQALTAYSAADLLPEIISRAAEFHTSWFGNRRGGETSAFADAGHESSAVDLPPTASTLRLMKPNDELVEPQLPAAQAVDVNPAPPIPVAVENAAIEPVPEAAATEPTQPIADKQAATVPWTVPQTLFEQLDRLVTHPFSSRWARSTIAQLHAVTEPSAMNENQRAVMLADLAKLTQEATQLADRTHDDRLRVELLRAHWGLSRRLDCWEAICDIRIASQSSPRVAARGSLSQLFDAPPQDASAARPELPMLSGTLEAYEQDRDPQLGRQVTQEQRALESSPDALDQSLADAVEEHYRNANVRIAITAELLNRVVAQHRSEARQVRDRIAGTPVRGRSHTQSQSRVLLHPATGYWHLDVETQGVVESDTLAGGGRARLRSFGATDFVAQKSIVVDSTGVRMNAATVGATNHARLAGVRTEFDWIPLLGAYARDRAVEQYRAKRRRAKAEVEAKVTAQAADDVDRETQEAVDRITQNVRERFSDPIANAGIEITPIELTTTQERLVARLRVAGTHQLGSHTPRPRALSDSLASLQLHESALTNAAVSLELDGGRFTAVELQHLLRQKFPRAAQANPTEARHDTVFEFAYRDAVQFRIGAGRLELMLKLASFEHDGRRTRDFIVHAFYVPVVEGLTAELVRDGPLGIEGRLSAGERARLHNVFNTVLSAERRLPLVQLESDTAQRLEGLMITQMVLEDGWIGLAIGPNEGNRVAERSRSLR
jgi:hypothetical protein